MLPGDSKKMNERIRQLALQAGQGEPFHIPPEFVEKFAELIVGECIDIARQHNNSGVIAESIEVYFKIKGEVK